MQIFKKFSITFRNKFVLIFVQFLIKRCRNLISFNLEWLISDQIEIMYILDFLFTMLLHFFFWKQNKNTFLVKAKLFLHKYFHTHMKYSTVLYNSRYRREFQYSLYVFETLYTLVHSENISVLLFSDHSRCFNFLHTILFVRRFS